MNMETQLANREQRIRLSSKGTLQATMPGGVALVDGQHVVGHLPEGSLVDGFQVWMPPEGDFGADITVSLGIPSNPTLFFNAVVLATGNPSGSASHNPGATPVEVYASNEPLVATIGTTTSLPTGKVHFNVGYSEVDTKCGKYTH